MWRGDKGGWWVEEGDASNCINYNNYFLFMNMNIVFNEEWHSILSEELQSSLDGYHLWLSPMAIILEFTVSTDTQSERCWFSFVVVRRRPVTNLSPSTYVYILLVWFAKHINKEMHILDVMPVLCLLPMIHSRRLRGRRLGWVVECRKLRTYTPKTGIHALHLRHCYV